MILKWFLSKTVRQAVALRGQVRRLLNHQRDILPGEAAGTITNAVREFSVALVQTTDTHELRTEMDKLEKRDYEAQALALREDRYQYFLLPAILFLFMELFLSDRRRRT